MEIRSETLAMQRVQQLRIAAIREGKAALVAKALATGSSRELNRVEGAQRNGPCPCGSGKKWKRCCRVVRT
jgi:uncharacterized protein YecA (UPF0149 family)